MSREMPSLPAAAEVAYFCLNVVGSNNRIKVSRTQSLRAYTFNMGSWCSSDGISLEFFQESLLRVRSVNNGLV